MTPSESDFIRIGIILPSDQVYFILIVLSKTFQIQKHRVNNGYGLSVNKYQKIVNGNMRTPGLRIAAWNCGRGLIQEGFSVKFEEIKQFINEKKPHCFAIIESDVLSTTSQTSRRMKFTTRELQEKLKIDGYKLELPRTWDQFGQARLFCYVSNEICSIRRLSNPAYDSIPNITLEVGIGRAKKTLVHFYYREWKNGVTGDDSQNGQTDLKLYVELNNGPS